MLRIDMHVHTNYSLDSFITPAQLVGECQKKKIDCVCITDHNTIDGALEFKEKVNVRVIIGEEIETERGEVIGLFLKEEVSPGLSFIRTIEMIKQQDGIVYVPHPFDGFRKSTVDISMLQQIIDKIDILEVFNSRTLFPQANRWALNFAQQHNIIPGVGSDAHNVCEVGNSYVEMEDFAAQAEFMRSLKDARLFMQGTPLFGRLKAKAKKIFTCGSY